MKIQSSSVLLTGQYRQELVSSKTLSSKVSTDSNNGSSHGVKLSLSTSTQQHQRVSASSQVYGSNSYNQHNSSYAAQQITEAITQQTVSVNRWHGQLTESHQGQHLEIESIQQHQYQENLTVEAFGKVVTEDGQHIDFFMALDFDRTVVEEQSAYFKGNVQLVDPLMINLNGGPVSLTNQYFEFDLFADGSNVKINKTSQGSGYLVFDRNSDGVVNDGSELFGPQTGNGFDELRQFDSDGNGWIDANDEIFSQLGVLTFNAKGEAVYQTAAEAGLGALYLGSIGSNYALLDDDGELLGSIQQNGVALSEQGEVLLLQEVHLRYELEKQAQQASSGLTSITINGQSMLNGSLGVELPDNLSRANSMLDASSMRERIAAAMSNFSLENEQADDGLMFLGVNDFSVNISRERFSLDVEDSDGKLAQLRQTVEMLKQMQQAQKERQQSHGPLAIYQKIANQ